MKNVALSGTILYLELYLYDALYLALFLITRVNAVLVKRNMSGEKRVSI